MSSGPKFVDLHARFEVVAAARGQIIDVLNHYPDDARMPIVLGIFLEVAARQGILHVVHKLVEQAAEAAMVAICDCPTCKKIMAAAPSVGGPPPEGAS